MEDAKKVSDLIMENKYQVVGFKPINTKYGESFILKMFDCRNGTEFEMFSTKSLTRYIEENRDNIPKGGFEIKKTKNGLSIEGSLKSSFTMF